MRRANGEGSIFKLGGKRRKPWAVRITAGYTPEGKQKYKYIGYYTTKTEAKAAINSYLVNPYNLDNKDVSLLDVYEKWLPTTSLSEKTLECYVSAFRKCEPIYDKPIREIKVYHIEDIMVGNTANSQKHLRNALKQVFAFAEKNEIIDKNIMHLVKTDKQVIKKQKTPFTLEQIHSLLEYKDHMYADTLNILLYTGLRINELFEIENENVFLEERYMIGGKKTAAGKNRIIPIHDEIYEIIKKRYERGHKYLISSSKGTRVDYSYYIKFFWSNLKKEFEFEQTPHDARHTFVTFASRQNLDRNAVQKIIGHKGTDITDHYTHRTKEELIAEINKLKY